jgi:hypothetical protein
MKLVLIVLAILIGGVMLSRCARAQSWVETVVMDDGRICQVVYTNGGRQRFVTCTP